MCSIFSSHRWMIISHSMSLWKLLHIWIRNCSLQIGYTKASHCHGNYKVSKIQSNWHREIYRPFHITETALLKVQSDILLNMDDQKVNLFVMHQSTQFTKVSYWKSSIPALVLVEQLWNGSLHISLKELNKWKIKELFQKRNSWPLVYHRDLALVLCCSPFKLPSCFRS